ncbi:Metallo-hydrolase/oxidoreductase [Tothia fuscella]|uniref:Metallo-hydrolase/oxidoreductase n=1 Tax=Tothia fuscella TaxID=1048955 RepID=A0A9P4NH31_9PEZI|nr:Metallo-hydrolase/oxidoreductase [Tothia fuscella]
MDPKDPMKKDAASSLKAKNPKTDKSTTRPAHHANGTATSFKNPWPSANAPTWNELLQLSFPFTLYPHLHKHKHAQDIEVVKPDWGEAKLKAKNLKRGDSGAVIGTWLGHAGAFVEFLSPGISEGVYALFDPIFSSRAGPTAYTGPGRFKKSPCRIADLPGCDAVFISHNHYDHLDLTSVNDVLKSFPETRWFVPLGNKKWLVNTGVKADLIVELDWWHDWEGQLGTKTTSANFKVSCVPTQHTSGRSGLDKDSTLWAGWVLEKFSTGKTPAEKATRLAAVYHAGDTGYRRTTKSDIVCPAFKEIGSRFGPFDLSFIPIWRGGTLGFISYLGLRLSHHDIPSALHCSPTDAVAIHTDVQSQNTIGIHFGTFIGSENESHDAIIEFCEARGEMDVKGLDDEEPGEKGRAGTVDIGASFVVATG